MDIFSILQLLSGLALFLYGMNTMGDGLEKFSGGKLEKTLEKMTNNTFKGFLLGAAAVIIRYYGYGSRLCKLRYYEAKTGNRNYYGC